MRWYTYSINVEVHDVHRTRRWELIILIKEGKFELVREMLRRSLIGIVATWLGSCAVVDSGSSVAREDICIPGTAGLARLASSTNFHCYVPLNPFNSTTTRRVNNKRLREVIQVWK